MSRYPHVSRTGVTDKIEHDDPANLPFPVVITLMHDGRVELYGAPDGFGGLEEYAGTLQTLSRQGPKHLSRPALISILKAVKKRVEEKPCSVASHFWLGALYPSGLLQAIEDCLE